MANTNIPITGEMLLIPSTMNVAVLMPNPAARAERTGKTMRAIRGESFLVNIVIKRARIVINPHNDNIMLTPVPAPSTNSQRVYEGVNTL
jgi:hypothetical protein